MSPASRRGRAHARGKRSLDRSRDTGKKEEEMARDHVVAQSKDASRKDMDNTYRNPILDTRMNQLRLLERRSQN